MPLDLQSGRVDDDQPAAPDILWLPHPSHHLAFTDAPNPEANYAWPLLRKLGVATLSRYRYPWLSWCQTNQRHRDTVRRKPPARHQPRGNTDVQSHSPRRHGQRGPDDQLNPGQEQQSA